MKDLIKRLEEATKGSGKLDREICETLGLLSSNTCEFNHWPLRVTSSIDAAVALAERVLPGWKRQLLEDFNGKWIARICSPRRDLYSTDYLRDTDLGGSANAALALCIAILKAKETNDASD